MTWLDVCNEALIMIGNKPIVSLDVNNEEAMTLELKYKSARDYVLGAHKWRCAKKLEILAPLTSEPAFGFKNQFQLPSDYISLVGLNIADYRIIGRTILCNADKLEMIYIWQVDDPTILSPHVLLCLELWLAHQISYRLVQSVELKESLFNQYKKTLSDAKWRDSVDEANKRWSATDLLEARQ